MWAECQVSSPASQPTLPTAATAHSCCCRLSSLPLLPIQQVLLLAPQPPPLALAMTLVWCMPRLSSRARQEYRSSTLLGVWRQKRQIHRL